MTRYEIIAPCNGTMAVMLTNLSLSRAHELRCSFGGKAVIRPIQVGAAQ